MISACDFVLAWLNRMVAAVCVQGSKMSFQQITYWRIYQLGSRAMQHYCHTWIEDWCNDNGWTDLFVVERNQFWAFPPHAVMPMPIPAQVLQLIKQQRGLSLDEQRWCVVAILSTVAAAVSSYLLQCPMPLVAAFALCALIVAQMETDDWISVLLRVTVLLQSLLHLLSNKGQDLRYLFL